MVARPAVAENHDALTAVFEKGFGVRAVCIDDAAKEVVAEFGFVSELLNPSAFKNGVEVKAALFDPVLAGFLIIACVRQGDHLGEFRCHYV